MTMKGNQGPEPQRLRTAAGASNTYDVGLLDGLGNGVAGMMIITNVMTGIIREKLPCVFYALQ